MSVEIIALKQRLSDIINDSPAHIIPWVPWLNKDTIFSSKVSGQGNGEARLDDELRSLGITCSLTDHNSDYDLDSDIGTIEVKAPDASGRIITAGQGHRRMSKFISECNFILKLFEPHLVNADPDEVKIFRSAQEKLEKGNFTEQTLGVVMDVLEVMSEMGGMWDAVQHNWILDPATFVSDCLMFPSECIVADHIALVCDEGYALLTQLDADNLFRFHGDAWGGRPKFFCSSATKKNRRDIIKTKNNIKKPDKIDHIERLKKGTNRTRKDRKNGDNRTDA